MRVCVLRWSGWDQAVSVCVCVGMVACVRVATGIWCGVREREDSQLIDCMIMRDQPLYVWRIIYLVIDRYVIAG